MQRLKTTFLKIRELSGLKAHALAIFLGAASVLSFAPVFAWGVMFLTLPLWIVQIDGVMKRCAGKSSFEKAKYAAAIGWSFGFGYFFASLFWIGEAFLVEAEKFAWALPFAISLLPAGLAIYFALGAALASFFWRPGPVRILALALALTTTEWVRGHFLTGFPWNTFGYTLTSNDGLMQLASIFGAYGLTPIAVIIFASPLILLEPVGASEAEKFDIEFWSWKKLAYPIAAVGFLIGAMLWGYSRLASPEPAPVAGAVLRLVQPNTPQKDKWNPAKRNQVFKRLLDVTAQTTGPTDKGLVGVTHVIWPESAFPFLVRRSPAALQAIADLLPDKTRLITGALRMDDPPPLTRPSKASTNPETGGGRKIFNAMLAIDTNGQTLGIYDKLHLVPFGEYLPFQNILEAIGLEQLTRLKGGLASGAGQRDLNIPGLPAAAPLICYEIIFPDNVLATSKKQTWLLNLTNDAWFGQSSGPYQHFHQARIRSVEEGLPVVRVANTGISAIIDPMGRVIKQIGLGQTGAFNAPLPAALTSTTYTTFRPFIILMEIIVLIILIFVTMWSAPTNIRLD